MAYVLKIAKPGYDAKTASNANLYFSSLLPSHSIYNVVSQTISSGTASATINHALGYVPKVWVFYEDGTALRRAPKDGWATSDSIDYYITSSDIIIEVEDTSVSYTFKVIIFTREP